MAAVAASIAGVGVLGERITRPTASKPPAEEPRKRIMAERQAEVEAKRRAG